MTLALILATLALILQGTVVPRLAILPFAPFLALAALRCELNQTLWLSVLAGSLMDLLSDDPMGLHALNYAITMGLLYRFRNHFSYDQPLHLSLFSSIISSLSTFLQLLLLFLFDRRVPFDGKWIFADLIGMPLIDALYAFVWFAAPLAFADQVRRMWVLFWLKRKNRSPISH